MYIFVHSLRENNIFKIIPKDELSFALFSRFQFSPNFFYASSQPTLILLVREKCSNAWPQFQESHTVSNGARTASPK